VHTSCTAGSTENLRSEPSLRQTCASHSVSTRDLTERAVVICRFSSRRVSHLEHWAADCNQVRTTTVADFLRLTRDIFSAELASLTAHSNVSLETGSVSGFCSPELVELRPTAESPHFSPRLPTLNTPFLIPSERRSTPAA